MKICFGCFYLHVGSWIVELKLCLAPFSNCSFYTLIFVDEANSETILSRSSAMRAIIPPLDMMLGCVSLFLPSISIPTTEDHDRVLVLSGHYGDMVRDRVLHRLAAETAFSIPKRHSRPLQ